MSENVQVLIRVRPLIQRESRDQQCISVQNNSIVLRETTGNQLLDEYANEYRFAFDNIEGTQSVQEDIFEYAKPLLDSFLQGFNASIMAYGLTSSGKTYTMFNTQQDQLGIVLRAITYVTEHLEECIRQSTIKTYKLGFSFVQIYNEYLSDLLTPEQQLKIRLADNATEVENLSTFQVQTVQDIQYLLEQGEQSRKTSPTKYNELSSRSHVIATLYLVTDRTSSKLNLVDLAGSERLASSLQTTQGQETKHINTSLSVLNKVIFALSERQKFIPYRDSVLTKLLSDSLGGNYRSLLICCASPASQCFYETLNSLRFAERAKRVVNRAVLNEIPTDEMGIEELERQLMELRAKLEEHGVENCRDKIEVLKQQIMEKQRIITGDMSERELKLLQQEVLRKRQQLLHENKDFGASMDKYQLVLDKQMENFAYLVKKINMQNANLNQFELEDDIQQKQLKKQQLTLKIQECQRILQGNADEKPTKTPLSEYEHAALLEGQVNALEIQNRQLVLKIEKAKNYLKELDEKTGQLLEKDVERQLTLGAIDSTGKDKLLRYYKEQKTLIKVFQKIQVMLDNMNIPKLKQLCEGVLEALLQTRDDYQ